jgi:hypothetical protein
MKYFNVDYYSHELLSMSGKILYEWFHDKFVLAVKEHLKSHNITVSHTTFLQYSFISK